ncbi:UNVERIFIED_CONTAM: Tetraspanin-8 [Sesamum calycinum]|uniref:Tetraspanin-8 n=1 Tax=Sesamum calycinum TaxID=2727403 RepID=A0AAW2NIJ6_9LAMI
MARVSNGMITAVNILTVVIALSAVGFSLWFHVKQESPCQKVLKTPILVVGAALLVVSLAGLVGSCCRVSFFMWFYLFVLFLLIVGLIVFTVFTIIVTNKGIGQALSRKGIGNHRLGDYSRWLQKYVINAENWNEIKSCLVDVKLCQRIAGGKAKDFYAHLLPPVLVHAFSLVCTHALTFFMIVSCRKLKGYHVYVPLMVDDLLLMTFRTKESGCCKPPNYCGFEFQNATYWIMPTTGPATPDRIARHGATPRQSCASIARRARRPSWTT